MVRRLAKAIEFSSIFLGPSLLRYTCNKNLTETADVLLMHRNDIRTNQLPRKRHADQIWLFWQDEPGGSSKRFNPYQFNWTISYRFNAEASFAAYGFTLLRKQPLSERELDVYVKNAFNKRTSSAVWFVSNCKPQPRLEYFHRLRVHYPSMITFGRCILSSSNSTSVCRRGAACQSSTLLSNKFYLAFESQSCRDYITEKFWRSLAYGAIPIVHGPRTKQSLTQMSPPNSFIYTGDFDTPSQLADHLRQIGRNRTLFGEYHRWRRFYTVGHRADETESYRFCELCHRLNTNRDRIYYPDLHSFFADGC